MEKPERIFGQPHITSPVNISVCLCLYKTKALLLKNPHKYITIITLENNNSLISSNVQSAFKFPWLFHSFFFLIFFFLT